MISKFVQVGNKIEIESIKKTTGELGEVTRKTYRSELYDIESEDIIKIAMPMEQSKIVLLPVDAEYSLCFYTPNGLYQCLARVVERYKSNNLFVLSMELETDLQKYQRREYYRLNTVLDMKSKAIDENEKSSLAQVQFIDTDLTFDNGTMVDISGGGARFISKVQYTEGSLIRFVFSLFVNGLVTEYKLVGKVLKSSPIENREDQFENRIQFVNMVNDDREAIIKYIFEEERKQRHRERGTF
ncbi:MAG: flagellar brake protein [Lachnospiraceae bacterium]|nr:flagellar brake protein [Lachnospiraceae bacterium]MBR4574991.1 flagellar brake protein [Lachnospiraceae bacterium]